MVTLLSFIECLLALSLFDIGDITDKVIVSVSIVIMNYIILPLIKKFLMFLRKLIKRKQKTEENDGELVDYAIEVIDIIQDKLDALNINEELNNDE